MYAIYKPLLTYSEVSWDMWKFHKLALLGVLSLLGQFFRRRRYLRSQPQQANLVNTSGKLRIILSYSRASY